jgi:hypothetical protein
MKNPNRQTSITFQVNYLLKKHKIEAKLEEITKLSKIIKNSIKFNQKLYDIGTLDGVSLATTVEDLMEIFALRSKVYKEIGFLVEFSDGINGLDYDEYDEHSAIIYSRREGITGTCRLIFDSDKKLPIDKHISVDYLRNQNINLAESSRVIIKDSDGLKPEFKLLTKDSYRILSAYNLNAVSATTQEHIKLYQNFGGLTVEKKIQNYGKIPREFFLTRWKTTEISPFFRRIFLRNLKAG